MDPANNVQFHSPPIFRQIRERYDTFYDHYFQEMYFKGEIKVWQNDKKGQQIGGYIDIPLIRKEKVATVAFIINDMNNIGILRQHYSLKQNKKPNHPNFKNNIPVVCKVGKFSKSSTEFFAFDIMVQSPKKLQSKV